MKDHGKGWAPPVPIKRRSFPLFAWLFYGVYRRGPRCFWFKRNGEPTALSRFTERRSQAWILYVWNRGCLLKGKSEWLDGKGAK